jgi:hypothetical protein
MTARKNTARHSASFACQCGQVRGRIVDPSRDSANRVVCYCRDCQAFAHAIGRPDILDDKGGTDVVQVAPAALTITDGQDRVRSLRLSEKGLYRFYASCCGTPLGNAVGPAIPVVGVPRQAFEVEGQTADALFGPVAGAVHGQGAKGEPPPGSKGIQFWLLMRAVLKVARWRLTGQGWPHPFFSSADRKPLFPVEVLSPERRAESRRQEM